MVVTHKPDGRGFGIGCIGTMPRVYAQIPNVDSSQDQARWVGWRINDGDLIEQTWKDDPAAHGAFTTYGEDAKGMIEALDGAERLDVVTEAANGFHTYVILELSDFDVAIAKVREACS